MRKQHFVLSFLVLIFIGLFTYYIIHFGYYPALSVNGRWVSTSRFNREVQATYTYYARQAEARGMTPDPVSLGEEVRILAMERLIEEVLVHQALRARFGTSIGERVDRKISEAVASAAELSLAAKTLYGWDSATLRAIVLKPQAEIDILREELSGTSYDDWLAAEKSAASVKIWFSPYRWDGEKIVER